MSNATIDTTSTKKQQQKDCILRTKMDRKILMDGAGPALPRTLILLTKRLGLGGLINSDMIVTMDRRPHSILGMI